jgi:glycosyltransferase involved in cell wall biosynthesis
VGIEVRIGIFTELFWPEIGGQEVRFEQLSTALALKGHDVSVYCISEDPKLPQYEVHRGVKIWRHPIEPRYRSKIVSWVRNPVTVLRYAYWTRRVARGEQFDAVFYNIWPVFHVLLAPAAIRRNAIVDWCEIQQNLPFNLLKLSLPPRVGLNLGVSPAVTEEIRQVRGSQVLYLASGVTSSIYANRPRAKRHGVLYLGRITRHKNLPLLIDAFARLRERGYPGRLTIAGAGSFLPKLREIVLNSSEGDQIDILGGVDEVHKIELLASTEVLVIPSKREGFPRVIAEAMASGAPVVTAEYPQNGSCDVVRHYRCGLVTAPDRESLALGIETAIAQWDEFSAAGRIASAELDWNVLVAKLERRMTLFPPSLPP